MLNNLKAEIEHLKKSLAELNVKVDRKIEDDVTFASIVARHVDEKLEWVKGDVGVIHTSIEEAKTSAKEVKELLSGEKDKHSRKNNIIVYRMTESSATATTERQKEDKEFFLKLLKDILKVECEDKDIKHFFCIK